MSDSSTICDLCPRECRIQEGQLGFCNGRKNIEGEIVPINYGKVLSLAMDPIEKKPLSHFKPGSYILSVGTFGCNMACSFCQNYTIARATEGDYPSYDISPETLVSLAKDRELEGNIGIAFTYNEPLVGFEYVRDTAKLAKENNLDTVVVTNGQINEAYLKEILPYISAWNIDLKAFSKEIYRQLGGDFETTLRTIELASQVAHVEVTTLVVPKISDDRELFKEEVDFLAKLDKNIPLHITRYFPRYHYREKMTSRKVLSEFYELAKAQLNYVELGNI